MDTPGEIFGKSRLGQLAWNVTENASRADRAYCRREISVYMDTPFCPDFSVFIAQVVP